MKATWVFDVISPFAYLGLQMLDRLPRDVELDFVPVLFAGLLKHYGQMGPAEIDSKRQWTYRFVVWRARSLGIPMRFPPAHPFNPLAALRLIIAAGSTRHAVKTVFDAAFLHGRDVSDIAVLTDVAQALRIDDIAIAINMPAVKQTLRTNTDWAIQHGIFGVPTFVVGEAIFWGHDALDMVLDYLRDPRPCDADAAKVKSLPIGVARLANG